VQEAERWLGPLLAYSAGPGPEASQKALGAELTGAQS